VKKSGEVEKIAKYMMVKGLLVFQLI